MKDIAVFALNKSSYINHIAHELNGSQDYKCCRMFYVESVNFVRGKRDLTPIFLDGFDHNKNYDRAFRDAALKAIKKSLTKMPFDELTKSVAKYADLVRGKIKAYIKKWDYTWTVSDILEEYQKYKRGVYVSWTAKDVIQNVILRGKEATNE